MKKLAFLLICVRLAAFEWPGGTMNVPYVFRGEETFAGWVPTSPWGSTNFTQDPAIELRDTGNQVIAVYTASGGVMDWYQDATREGTATFSVSAGTYSITARDGRRHVRIPGEGWSGFRLFSVSIVEPAGTPVNAAPTIQWLSAPANADHGQGYSISARGSDADGNLVQVNVWKNGIPLAFGGGGSGFESDSGSATSDGGPQTVTFTAQAVDAAGATSAMIAHVVNIGAPAPAEYSLAASAGSGGSVSGGGLFTAGATAAVAALPDSNYEFSGWSGDAAGTANPLSILMDGNKSVQANFVLKSFPLSTSAASGGSVSPGGSFPYGTTITVSANPDALHYFTGWSGDASGAAPTVTVLVDRAKSVQALFAPKSAQTITFAGPGGQAVGSTLPLSATASSGLPVSFVLLSGPATLSGSDLTITGPGAVSVQAVQPGNAVTLPATPVAVTFNAAGPVVVRYRPAARTILQAKAGEAGAAYVIGNP